MVAQTYSELMDEVDFDKANPISSWKLAINTYKITMVLDIYNGKLNENALTYFNQNKNKYNELNLRLQDLKDKYSSFTIPKIPWTIEYISNLNNNDLSILFKDFNDFKCELEDTINEEILWNDETWTLIWGEKKDKAKSRYQFHYQAILKCYDDLKHYIENRS